MSRVIISFLALCLALSLTGCGSSSEDKTTPPPKPPPKELERSEQIELAHQIFDTLKSSNSPQIQSYKTREIDFVQVLSANFYESQLCESFSLEKIRVLWSAMNRSGQQFYFVAIQPQTRHGQGVVLDNTISTRFDTQGRAVGANPLPARCKAFSAKEREKLEAKSKIHDSPVFYPFIRIQRQDDLFSISQSHSLKSLLFLAYNDYVRQLSFNLPVWPVRGDIKTQRAILKSLKQNPSARRYISLDQALLKVDVLDELALDDCLSKELSYDLEIRFLPLDQKRSIIAFIQPHSAAFIIIQKGQDPVFAGSACDIDKTSKAPINALQAKNLQEMADKAILGKDPDKD